MLRLVFLFALCVSPCLCQNDFVQGDLKKLLRWMEKPLNATGKRWVLLAAGSKDYDNYRHQADVCHAYQVVHQHGVPDSQIVVMMYDDIVNHPSNPFKGAIYNRPYGPNVYDGVPKDYTGGAVTASNFLSVLTGNKAAVKGIGSGRVIASGPNDHVFVFYSDHGSPGLLCFPTGPALYKNQLANAISGMHTAKKYAEMVIYIEACFSGSLFYQNLATNTKVYATTAANRFESSYACYWNGQVQAYLGDMYSVSWMEDSDSVQLSSERLYEQYQEVKGRTKGSEVKEFGDNSVRNNYVGNFQGDKSYPSPNYKREEIRDQVPSPDAKLHTLKNKIAIARSVEVENNLRKKLNEEYEIRNAITKTIRGIGEIASEGQDGLAAMSLYAYPELNNMPCYQEAVEQFGSVCYDYHTHEFVLQHLYVLGNLCDAGVPTEKILSSINQECSK